MAKNKPPRVEGSILLRSAESLGRVIGSLQRQIDDVAERLRSQNGSPPGAAARKKAAPRPAKGEGAPPDAAARAKARGAPSSGRARTRTGPSKRAGQKKRPK